MNTINIELDITAEDIANGQSSRPNIEDYYMRSRSCPATRAGRRIFPRLVGMGTASMTFTTPTGTAFVPIPDDLRQWIMRADWAMTDGIQPSPQKFIVPIPEHLL